MIVLAISLLFTLVDRRQLLQARAPVACLAWERLRTRSLRAVLCRTVVCACADLSAWQKERLALQCVALRCVAMRRVAMRCVALQRLALRCDAMPCNGSRCVALRCNGSRCVALR